MRSPKRRLYSSPTSRTMVAQSGIAKADVPYRDADGPNFANFGTFFYRRDVVSFGFAQHF